MKIIVEMVFETEEENYTQIKQSTLKENIDDCMYDIAMTNNWEQESFAITLDKT